MGVSGFMKFFLSIVFPSILTILLFIFSFYLLILPGFEKNMMEGKKEMTLELTSSARSLVNEYYLDFINGKLSEDEAKVLAAEKVGRLRYGNDRKDYFWITDMEPNMIMHPYRPELDDLKNYTDPDGKKLFVDAVELVKEEGDGFIDYRWQWKDDSSLIVPKLSYVCAFPEWDWVIGTGIYLEDVKEEIKFLERSLLIIITSIIVIVSLALLYIIRQSMLIENKRRKAEQELLRSQQKYKILVESSTIGTLMISGEKIIYANKKFIGLSGIGSLNLSGMKLEDIFELQWEELISSFKDPGKSLSVETKIIVGGIDLPVLLSASKVSYENADSYIIVVNELSERDLFYHHKERLKTELQTRLLLLTNTDDNLLNEYLDCNLDIDSEPLKFREKYIKMTALAESLYSSGASSDTITSYISLFADKTLETIIKKAIGEEGEAPCDFSFIVMGSQGRMEETLATDQDNGIIIGDIKGDISEVKEYFIRLGKRVSDYLDSTGYEYCKGGIMASNTLWVKTLDEWKKQFSDWINKSDPQSLLDINIFFDFRSVFGNSDLAVELRSFVHETVKDKSVFFYHMSETVAKFKPSSGGVSSKQNYDTKKLTMPIAGFARLYSLSEDINETNTLRRLEKLKDLGKFDKKLIDNAVEAFSIISSLRLRTQIKDISDGNRPGNLLESSEISEIESATLKKTISYINDLIATSRIDFQGLVS